MSSDREKFEHNGDTARRTVIHRAEELEAERARNSFAEHVKAGAKKDVERTAKSISDEGLFTSIIKTAAKIVRTVITFPFDAVGSALMAVGIIKPDPRVMELMQKNEAMNRARKEKAEREAIRKTAKHADIGNSVPEKEHETEKKESKKEEKTEEKTKEKAEEKEKEKSPGEQKTYKPEELTVKPAKKGIREYMRVRGVEIFSDAGGNAFLASYRTDSLHVGMPKISAGRIASSLDISAQKPEDHFTNAVFAAAYLSSARHGSPVRIPGVPGVPERLAVTADKSMQLVQLNPDRSVKEVLCDCASSWPPQFADMIRDTVEKRTGRDPVKSINMGIVKSRAEKSVIHETPQMREMFEKKKAAFSEKIKQAFENEHPRSGGEQTGTEASHGNGPEPQPETRGPEPEQEQFGTGGSEPQPDFQQGPDYYDQSQYQPSGADYQSPDQTMHSDMGYPWGGYTNANSKPIGEDDRAAATQQVENIGRPQYSEKYITDIQSKLMNKARGLETFTIPGRSEVFVCGIDKGVFDTDHIGKASVNHNDCITRAMDAAMATRDGENMSVEDYVQNGIAASVYSALECIKDGNYPVSSVYSELYDFPDSKYNVELKADGNLAIYGHGNNVPLYEGPVDEPEKFVYRASTALINDAGIDIEADTKDLVDVEDSKSWLCDEESVRVAAEGLNEPAQNISEDEPIIEGMDDMDMEL